MATRKGIIVTIIILVAIAAGSSIAWILPQNRGSTIVVSDYGNEIEGVKERHALIMSEMDSDLKSMLNNTLSPDDFVSMAKTSSSQITSLVSELIEANPPTEWRESYLNYDEALKKYNDYLTETISLANKVKGGISPNDMSDEMSKLESLKNDTNSFIMRSNETRP
ncbi:MAG TPA: hypothetical protein VJ771_01675 [Candidatus Nitrosotalea sp.]|nr:hypothetical protein [Candidatus Nitrosotalea sp.]